MTEIERIATQFLETVPEIQTYSREDFFCSGAASILTLTRQIVNDNALGEPKSAYEKGRQEGIIMMWEKVAEMFVHDGDDLPTLLGHK